MTMFRFATLAPLVFMAGCIGYAPSNSNYRLTPKVVVQICSPSTHNGKAEVVLYSSSPLISFGFGTSILARGRTVSGQEVFEEMLDDPSQLHDAIGIRIHSETPQKFYIFSIPKRYSNDWSQWAIPVGEENNPPAEIDRFKYQRGKKPLDAASIRHAPRLRTRLEHIFDYENRTRSKTVVNQLPDC